MDRIDQSQGSMTEKDATPKKLFSTPYIFMEIQESRVVMFGNTGFDINFDPKVRDCTFDFHPEGKSRPSDDFGSADGIKYSSMLGVSLLELHGLLSDEKKLSEFEIDFSKTK